MLPSLASLSLNGRTCRPCRGAASIDATKEQFLAGANPEFTKDLLCIVCMDNLYEESYANPTPEWARSKKFKDSVFGEGKSSKDMKEWPVVAVCNNEKPHVLHIGCAVKWFATQLSNRQDPTCPVCRKSWDKDLSKAFSEKDTASKYNSIMSETNEQSGVAYYDFEYERAKRAIDAAKMNGLDAISKAAIDLRGELENKLLRREADALRQLAMYPVTEDDLEKFNSRIEKDRDTALTRLIEAYISTEVAMKMLDAHQVQWVAVEFEQRDLFRPVMQYYFYVCKTVMENIGPDLWFPRWDLLVDEDFDHTMYRAYYLQWYPPPGGTVTTELKFFDMYPDSVWNPYEVENIYHVSFLAHRIKEIVSAYRKEYNVFSISTVQTLIGKNTPFNDAVLKVREARERVDSMAQTLSNVIDAMARCASEALYYLRLETKIGFVEPYIKDRVDVATLVKSIRGFGESYRLSGIAKLVQNYVVPDGEQIMRDNGMDADFYSSRDFLKQTCRFIARMSGAFTNGMYSVNELIESEYTWNEVDGALFYSQSQVIPAEVLWRDSNSDAGRTIRQRTV